MGLCEIAARMRALAGRRRAAVAAALGACAALALPPIHLLPLAVVGFAGLVWLLEGASGDARRPALAAFLVGWWFGFGHFALGLYWIANALLIEWERVGWMIPFAVFGLAAVLGVFTGLATSAVHASRARGVGAAFALAIAWSLCEWLRGHVLTGFPWNLTATVWAESPPMIQSAALFGAYGLSALTVLAFALPAALAARDARARWVPTLAAALLVAAGWGVGSYRLAGAGGATVPDVRLRLVQPNVPQALKWDPEAREANLRRMIALTRQPGFETRTHTIWSETATAFPVWGDNEILAQRRAQVAAAVPPGGMLVTGAPRFERAADGTLRVWNSLHAMDGDGTIHATYDKFHLVPFGEYVPFREILPIDRVVPGGIDFSAGPGPRLLSIRGLPLASPLICYEVIFPGQVVPDAGHAELLLNVTNDSWFGDSAGPYQHLAAARLRAVEEGLALVRSAGGGISAIIDPYGRIHASLGLGVAGVLDSELPVSIGQTFFAQQGNAAFVVLILALWSGLLVARKSRFTT